MAETRDRIWDVSKARCGCGKWTYLCRRDARRAARVLHPGTHLRAYLCRVSDGAWHLGHPLLASA